MVVRLTVDGGRRLLGRLTTLAERGAGADAVVGYSARYALFVHEDLEAHHPVGEARFLSRALRAGAPYRRAFIADALRRGRSLYQAVRDWAFVLKRDSQARCPVDTGVLRASAFVESRKTL